MKHGRRQREWIDRKPGGGRAQFLLRPAQQPYPGAGIDRASESVVRPDQKAVGQFRGNEVLGAFRGRKSHIGVGGEGRVGVDQIDNAVVEVGRTKAHPIIEERLLEARVIARAFLRLQIGVTEEIEVGKVWYSWLHVGALNPVP